MATMACVGLVLATWATLGAAVACLQCRRLTRLVVRLHGRQARLRQDLEADGRWFDTKLAQSASARLVWRRHR